MPLDEEITKSSREIFTDGYEMSLGELMSLYKDKELIINPEFQRYFRWKVSQKTKFIESLLLGIPIPPIFVFQTEKGVWELIDGLQRLSTIFEFAGILRKNGVEEETDYPVESEIENEIEYLIEGEDKLYPPSMLEGTRLLPSLVGKRWEPSNEIADDGIGKTLQLRLKRARMRVEILKKESDSQSKYELFQRLNTGGSSLSEQEIRNCMILMINKEFFTWLRHLSTHQPFITTITQTEVAEKKQKDLELALRFLVFRSIPYQNGLDVHEYLDDGAVKLASDTGFNKKAEEISFQETFSLLDRALGDNVFKRHDGSRYLGQFLMSAFEVIAIGVSKNLLQIKQLSPEEQILFIQNKVRELWNNQTFKRNSGAGVRGTTRLANLLPLSKNFFKP